MDLDPVKNKGMKHMKSILAGLLLSVVSVLSADAQAITDITRFKLFTATDEWSTDMSDLQTFILTNGTWDGSPIGLNYLDQTSATTGQVIKWNGTQWAPGTDDTGGGGGGGGAPTSAQYLVLATDATLTNERVFTPGNNIAITDGGAGGNYTVESGTKSVAYPGDITPSAITLDLDNYNPSGLADAGVLRLDVQSAVSMSGLSGGADGRVIVIYNVGTSTLSILHNNVLSSSANRFFLPEATTMLLPEDRGAQFMYDATQSRWICIGSAQVRGVNCVVYEYTTQQTNTDVTIPTGAVSFEVLAIGGGGGGGSGRKGAAGSVRCGGGGGAPGAVCLQTFSVDAYGSNTLRLNIGAAAAGGASVSTNSTSGNNGTAGVNTTVGTTGGVFITVAGGGARGNGGTGSNGTGGAATTTGMFFGGAGAGASATGGAGAAGANALNLAPGSGASGAGITTGNAASAGNGGGAGYYNTVSGGTAGNSGSEPTNGKYTGGGGGSGGSSTVGNATAGGNGGRGAGGGGGGAAVDSVGNSGAGGSGGIGYIRLTFYF
jgi:hypothetical protein